MTQPADDSPPQPIDSEPPDLERPASVSPTEAQLETESPAGFAAHEKGHDPYEALRLSGYRLYSAGWFLSVIGHQVQSVAVGWEVYERTGSALSLGWVGLAQALPILVLALPAGHIADRFDRRRVVQVSLALSALCSVALAGVSWAAMPVGWIYALLTMSAIARAVGWPARASLLPQVVPPEVFNNAVTWNSSFFHTASVLGPALAGPVLLAGAPLAYLLDAAGSAAMFLLIGGITLRPIARSIEPATLHSLLAGVRFVWRTKVILATITLDLIAVLLGGAVFVLPAVAEDILHVGPLELGWLRASPAAGAIVASLLMAHLPPLRHAGWAMLWSVAGFGGATILFGFSDSLWLSLLALALTGGFDTVSVVVRHTLIQALPPDEMRGRVAAVNTVFIGASNELGGFESGVAAEIFGLARSIVLGGVGTMLAVAGVGAIWPQLRNLGSLRDIRPLIPASNAEQANA